MKLTSSINLFFSQICVEIHIYIHIYLTDVYVFQRLPRFLYDVSLLHILSCIARIVLIYCSLVVYLLYAVLTCCKVASK